MRLWVDAQLPPGLCRWLHSEYGLETVAVRTLGLRDAEDSAIFDAAREAGAVIMSKDADFAELVHRNGPPPQVLWVTCGNTTNRALRQFLARTLDEGLRLLEAGEPLVQLADATGPPSEIIR